LDVENDAQRCNTATIVVIAAQESAGLGMGWVTYEYQRRVVGGGANALVTGGTVVYPGDDVAACVLLGPGRQPKPPASMSFRPVSWFGMPSSNRMRDNTPMCFIYGKQDRNSSGFAPELFTAIKRPPDGKSAKGHKWDREIGLETSLPGQDL